MKVGAFLKENRTQEHRDSKRLAKEEHTERKAKRLRAKKQRQWLLRSIVILIVLLTVAVVAGIALPTSPLEGKWDMDGVTSYEFYKNGKGAMVLPSAEYEFVYEIEDNTVYIYFLYDGAKDAQYIFAVDGDVLTLDGGNATVQDTYILTKHK